MDEWSCVIENTLDLLVSPCQISLVCISKGSRSSKWKQIAVLCSGLCLVMAMSRVASEIGIMVISLGQNKEKQELTRRFDPGYKRASDHSDKRQSERVKPIKRDQIPRLTIAIWPHCEMAPATRSLVPPPACQTSDVWPIERESPIVITI